LQNYFEDRDTRPAMDAPAREGTARDALAVPDFRRVYWSSFASNIGRWMQNVALGVLAFEQTEDPSFTTLVISVQMIPLLVLSIVGGSLADSMDRRVLLIATQSWQAVLSGVLAWHVWDGTFDRTVLLLLVFLTGLGQALFAPAFNAILPTLVGRQNLSAAISLNSAQMNGSRVVGPVIGGLLIPTVGIGAVFALNAVTYLVVISALASVAIPTLQPLTSSIKDRLLGGIRIARRSSPIGRSLLIMTTFSLLCLPFIGLMPVIAEQSLGVDAKSPTFGFLYGAFGLGALAGAISVGTLLLQVPKQQVVRFSLGSFGVALAAFAMLETAAFAFPVLFLVGLFYFTMPTALSTFLQLHLGDEVRGRVMALWIISFGGTVAITNLVSGALVELTSLRAVLLGGAATALLMAVAVRLEPGPMATDALLDEFE
jgi:MFS family permease